eukprot:TRINITY_DN11420_c0_g1_i1.p1 TRINITY_DN11420_c0_g1~~TRINITY_DN11420_c0_g1_i1.p1  ORF type:complete len:1094 (+),score=186.66 TRINITY_DN11420_c0_g1_i1:295-3282(+)
MAFQGNMKSLLTGMLNDIEAQHKLAQGRMNQLKDPVTVCQQPKKRGTPQSLNKEHSECRKQEAGLGAIKYHSCRDAEELAQMQKVHCDQVASLSEMPDVLPRMCETKEDIDKDSEAHAKRIRDWFESYIAKYDKAKIACDSVTGRQNSDILKCKNATEEHNAMKLKCDALQNQVDDRACELYTDFDLCQRNNACFKTAYDYYVGENTTMAEAHLGRVLQWTTLKRMECMLDAPLKSLNSVEECAKQEFKYPYPLKFTYYAGDGPRSLPKSPNCTIPDFPRPGSYDYKFKVYNGLSRWSPAKKCESICCTMCSYYLCGGILKAKENYIHLKGNTDEECCVKPDIKWVYREWKKKECPTKCGMPLIKERRDVKCQEGEEVIDEKQCRFLKKPELERTMCNATAACAGTTEAGWVAEEWPKKICQSQCGADQEFANRTVQCQNIKTGKVVPESFCNIASMPDTEITLCPRTEKCRTCELYDCPPHKGMINKQTFPECHQGVCTNDACCHRPMVYVAENGGAAGKSIESVRNQGYLNNSMRVLGKVPVVETSRHTWAMAGESSMQFLGDDEISKSENTSIAFSVEAFLKVFPRSSGTEDQIIMQRAGAYESKGYWAIKIDSTGSLKASSQGDGGGQFMNCECDSNYFNQWVSVALTYNAKKMQFTLYANGAVCCQMSKKDNKRWTDFTKGHHPLKNISIGSGVAEGNDTVQGVKLNASLHSASYWEQTLEKVDVENLAKARMSAGAAWGPDIPAACPGQILKSTLGVRDLAQCKYQCKHTTGCRAALYYKEREDHQACHSLQGWACRPHLGITGDESDCRCITSERAISSSYLGACTKGAFSWKIEVSTTVAAEKTAFTELSLKDSKGAIIQQGTKPYDESKRTPVRGCGRLSDGSRDGVDCTGKSAQNGGYWRYDFQTCALPRWLAYAKASDTDTTSIPRTIKIYYQKSTSKWEACQPIEHQGRVVAGINEVPIVCPTLEGVNPWWELLIANDPHRPK